MKCNAMSGRVASRRVVRYAVLCCVVLPGAVWCCAVLCGAVGCCVVMCLVVFCCGLLCLVVSFLWFVVSFCVLL